MNYTSIGSLVRKRRQGLGNLSQEALAKRAGVHRNTVSHLEAGGSVRTPTLLAVADALGVSVSDLFKEPRRRRA